jgi:hypothetical protein
MIKFRNLELIRGVVELDWMNVKGIDVNNMKQHLWRTKVKDNGKLKLKAKRWPPSLEWRKGMYLTIVMQGYSSMAIRMITNTIMIGLNPKNPKSKCYPN